MKSVAFFFLFLLSFLHLPAIAFVAESQTVVATTCAVKLSPCLRDHYDVAGTTTPADGSSARPSHDCCRAVFHALSASCRWSNYRENEGRIPSLMPSNNPEPAGVLTFLPSDNNIWPVPEQNPEAGSTCPLNAQSISNAPTAAATSYQQRRTAADDLPCQTVNC